MLSRPDERGAPVRRDCAASDPLAGFRAVSALPALSRATSDSLRSIPDDIDPRVPRAKAQLGPAAPPRWRNAKGRFPKSFSQRNVNSRGRCLERVN